MTPEPLLSFSIPLPHDVQQDPIVVLRAAREYGSKEEIATGTLCDSQGRACALGLIGIVRWGADYMRIGDTEILYDRLENDPAVALVFEAIEADDKFAPKIDSVRLPEGESGHDRCEVVIAMNDAWATSETCTPEEHRERVLGVFDRAIEIGQSKAGTA